jgi:hypothetical protein
MRRGLVKTFALLIWIFCNNGKADHAIPMSPERCAHDGPVIMTEVRVWQPTAVMACGFIEGPAPSEMCWP